MLPLHFGGHRPSGRQPRGRARLPIRRSVKNALGRVSPGRAAPVHTEERRVIGGHPRKPCRARRERGARRALPGRGGEPTRAERGKGVPADRAVSPLSAPRSSANKYEVSAICGSSLGTTQRNFALTKRAAASRSWTRPRLGIKRAALDAEGRPAAPLVLGVNRAHSESRERLAHERLAHEGRERRFLQAEGVAPFANRPPLHFSPTWGLVGSKWARHD